MPTIREQIAARARNRDLKQDQDARRAQLKKQREKDRAKVAKALETLPSGLSRKVVSQIQAAAKKADEDPEARAMIQRAQDLHRIQRLKRAQGGNLGKPHPDTFMGIPIEEYNKMGAPSDVEKALPPFPKSMAEMRARQRADGKTKGDKVRDVVEQAKRKAMKKAPLKPDTVPDSLEAFTEAELEKMTAPEPKGVG